MDTFSNVLQKGAGMRPCSGWEGCQEGRTDVFKHTGWDSSHVTNHSKTRHALSLTLSVVHAEAGSFQKAICPVPKGVRDGWDQESSGGFAILVAREKAQATLRLNTCLLVGAVNRDKPSSLLGKAQITVIPPNF